MSGMCHPDAAVAGLADSWRWIWEEWLPSSGLTPADTPDFESYGEGFDPEAGARIVEIWFPVVDPEDPEGSAEGG